MDWTTIAQSTKMGVWVWSLKNANFEIVKVQKWKLYQIVCHPKKLFGTKFQLHTYFGQGSIFNQWKKNIWFLDHNFKFSKDTNPKFGPENANEIYYYCPKYQTQTPPKMAFYQTISKIIKV